MRLLRTRCKLEVFPAVLGAAGLTCQRRLVLGAELLGELLEGNAIAFPPVTYSDRPEGLRENRLLVL